MYAGEIKKSAFTVMNYLLPDEGVLPMHSSINVGKDGDVGRLLRPLGDGQDDAVRRSAAEPHRRRRARLGRRLRLQLRGRLLRQDDPPVARRTSPTSSRRRGASGRSSRTSTSTRRRASSTSTPSGSPRTPAAPTRSHFIGNADPTGIAGHAAQRRLPDRRRVRRPAADLAPDPRAGRLPLHQRLHGQARRHRDRGQGADGDVLRGLRRAVPAAPSGRVRRAAHGPPRPATTSRSGS